MFYLINKIVGAVVNPLGLALVALLVAAAWGVWRKSWKAPVWAALACVAWLWAWGTNAMTRVVGLPLERGWEIVKAEDAPVCDAIVLLGGGMSAAPEAYPYADMHSAADRVWHAARLYRAGKAPLVVPTGSGDRESTEPLLRDFGVPQEAIRGEYAARNTEENARNIERLFDCLDCLIQTGTVERAQSDNAGTPPIKQSNNQTIKQSNNPPRRVLLVTSAWHMKRSVLMYQKYAPGLDIVPAPADFENTVACAELRFQDFLPSCDAFNRNAYMFKELVGYWGYRLLRR